MEVSETRKSGLADNPQTIDAGAQASELAEPPGAVPTAAEQTPRRSSGRRKPPLPKAVAARRSYRAGGPLKQTPAGAGRARFRIRFEVEEVLEAVDVRDALRQALSNGITNITAVNRED